MPEADDLDPESFDYKYIAAEVMMPKRDQLLLRKVRSRKHDLDGNPIGKRHSNPSFDTRIYQVEFPDAIDYRVTDEAISEENCSQVSSNGN